jgi:hypothetical protein
MTETERDRLKKVIKQVWGSQRACAAELGIGEEHLSDILRGKYPIPGQLLTLVVRKGHSIDALYDTPPTIAADQMPSFNAVEYCAARLSNAELLSIIQQRLVGEERS